MEAKAIVFSLCVGSFSEGSSKVIVEIKNTHVDGKQEEGEVMNNDVEMGKNPKGKKQKI